MSAGRIFTEPVLIFLLIQFVVAISLFQKRRRTAVVLAISTSLLWLLSMPLVAALLERAISRTAQASTAPQIIVIAGGGLSLGPDTASHELSYDSRSRVIAAAELHRRFPEASLVFTGTTGGGPPIDTEARLARELLVERGVPREIIALEVHSETTRDHPIKLTRMGIGRESRIGLVTSSWHMRRAARVFRRHYDEVLEFPAPPSRWAADDWRQWLPRSGGLDRSTLMVWEMIGTVWYAVRSG